MPPLTWTPRRLLLPQATVCTTVHPHQSLIIKTHIHSGHQHSGRRSRRRAQLQTSAATTSSSTHSLEASSLQQGVSTEGDRILLSGAPLHGSSMRQEQQQQQQQQQQEPHHRELQNHECKGECQGGHQSTRSSSLQQELSVNSMTPPSSMHSQANGRDATPEAARLQVMASLMTATVPRSRLHRPTHRPDPSPQNSSVQHQTVPQVEPRHQHQQHQQQSFILFPPPDASSGSPGGSNSIDPSPDGMHFPLQPPLQVQLGNKQAPSKKHSAVLGARWGKWVLHMRPWYALLRPWWCRKPKRRRRPKPNRFRMTISRTSDLDILQELQQFGQQQQQQQQHEAQPDSARAVLHSSHHTSGSSSSGSSSSSSQLGQLVTTLVMQPRHSISKPAMSSIHTLGGALSNRNKPWAHYTLDGGTIWISVPFSNVRTAQGALLLAAQLDCSSISSSSNRATSTGKRGASMQASNSCDSHSDVSRAPAAHSAFGAGAPAAHHAPAAYTAPAADYAPAAGAPAAHRAPTAHTAPAAHSAHAAHRAPTAHTAPAAHSSPALGAPAAHSTSASHSAPAVEAPASAALQVIVTTSPHPPAHSTGNPHKWRYHLLQLQPGACYMLEDAAAARKRTQSPKGASYPLSIAHDPLARPLKDGSAAALPAPPPFPLLPPSAPHSLGSLHSSQATQQEQQHHQPQELRSQQQQQRNQGRLHSLQATQQEHHHHQPQELHLQQLQQQQQQQQQQPPLFHRLLQQSVVLVASVHMVAGRQRCPEDDAGVHSFHMCWRHSNLLHPSLLVYTTHRCWRSYQQLWRDKQHVLQAPDVLILASGTRIMYQVAGGRWQEDTQWRAVLDDGWDRGRVVQAAEAVATAMNKSPPKPHAQRPQHHHPELPHHVDQEELRQQDNLGSNTLQQAGSLHGAELRGRGAAAGEEQQRHHHHQQLRGGAAVGKEQQHHHQHQQHQQHLQEVAKGASPPQTLVRADVVKEQNSHRVRMLVRTHAADVLLAALQRELERARVHQQEELLAQHLQQLDHTPLLNYLQPDTRYRHSRASVAAHSTSPSSACRSQGDPWSSLSFPMHAHTHQHHPNYPRLKQQQEHLQHSQLSQQPLSTSSRSSGGLGCVEPRALPQQQQQQQQQQRNQQRPMAWSLVLQPPHVIGQGRGWAAVDVIPHRAGVGPAVAHVLARFGINAAPPPLQQQQQQRQQQQYHQQQQRQRQQQQGPGEAPWAEVWASNARDQEGTVSEAKREVQRPQAGCVPQSRQSPGLSTSRDAVWDEVGGESRPRSLWRPQARCVPVVACTNSVHDQESLRQVSTLNVTHVPPGALRRRGCTDCGGVAEGDGDHLPVAVSHSWGAAGILEGLSKLGLS